MQDATIKQTAEHFHVARMAPYMAASDGNERVALELYLWNVRMSAAFMETIAVTEVVFRNAIDARLREWNASKPGFSAEWTTRAAAPLNSLTRNAIDHRRGGGARPNAMKARSKRPADHPRKHAPITHDDVIAQLTFGVFARLMPTRDTTRSDHVARRTLWNEALAAAFPHRPGDDERVHAGRVDRIHALRNRVAHAETIIDVNARSRMRDMVRLVQTIDPVLAGWVSGTTRIMDVARERPIGT